MICPFDRLIVIQEAAEEKTAGGIIIPEKAKKKTQPFKGKVYACGDKCQYVKMGDIVMFDSEKVFTDRIAGEEYVFMKEEAVLVITNR
jgi:chaperonin GroES